MGEIPRPSNEVGTQERNQRLSTQNLWAEDVRKDTLVMMQVDR